MSEPEWWRGAVVYQVYVRSFFDSNGDGQGDLPGVLAKLDYIAALGVDAIWLSPIHPSPNRDWGYDIADYLGVQPDYGSLDDLKALIDAAHARGIKVLLDEVLAHTSDEHPWFLESRAGGRTKDWYVWADPAPDGTAPNNWLSVFGGPAWSYQPDRRQHYHHKFLRQQPKLNWRNPEARAAALSVLDLWLEQGVDGFRLDVANAYLHDATLTDNPAVPIEERTAWHWGHAGHLQRQLHDANLPENLTVLDEIRRRVERFPGAFVFGEFSEEAERAGGFAAADEGLHAGYSFPLLIAKRLGPDFIREHFEGLARHPLHWPCVSFSNHDVTRTVSRFGDGGSNPALAKLMIAVLVTLKGTVLIYQGEELGLPEADLLRHQLRDPVGDLYYPVAKGRDGCRTPMPWQAGSPHHGFTRGTPWLPAAPEHADLTADRQEADPESPLNFARRLIGIRKSSASLRWGSLEFVEAPAPILAFRRRWQDDAILCIFNMGGEPVTWTDAPEETEGPLTLRPYGGWLSGS
jgi:alpha-glucosidase